MEKIINKAWRLHTVLFGSTVFCRLTLQLRRFKRFAPDFKGPESHVISLLQHYFTIHLY